MLLDTKMTGDTIGLDTTSGNDNPEEIISNVEVYENSDDCYKYDTEEEEEDKRDLNKFGTNPKAKIGCFGSLMMYFVNKKQKKIRKHHVSLISRNRGFRHGFNRSMRKLKDRTVSMMSIASTNWKSSRMHLAESMTNISSRSSRKTSKADSLPARMRHLSMQDRLETYNEELAYGQDNNQPITRKTSKISFEPPSSSFAPSSPTDKSLNLPAGGRARKISKISTFEFLPEENEKSEPLRDNNELEQKVNQS